MTSIITEFYPVPLFLVHLRADAAEAEEENSNDAVALVTAAAATLLDATFSLCHRQQCPLRSVLHARSEDTYQSQCHLEGRQ